MYSAFCSALLSSPDIVAKSIANFVLVCCKPFVPFSKTTSNFEVCSEVFNSLKEINGKPRVYSIRSFSEILGRFEGVLKFLLSCLLMYLRAACLGVSL